jgi:beta-glucanase (GH16 family)
MKTTRWQQRGRQAGEAGLCTSTLQALRRLAAGLSVLLVLASVGCSSASGSSSQATPPWKQVWSDNFNGRADAGVNDGNWQFDTGRGVFGTGEIETMTSSRYNAHLDGHGNLDIIVLGHGAAGSSDAAWTSARIKTRRLFGAPVGGEMMVTASLRQPDPAHALGYWPGFWMLPPNGWPATGEIDILEDVNGLSKTSGTLHCGNLTDQNPDGTTGPCHEKSGLGSGLRDCPGCQQAFHTYSVIIDRRHAGNEQIRWYLDGRQFYSVNESRIGQAAWTAAVDHGFSILLNVAIGGAFPDAQCGCTTPDSQTSSEGTMVVQYVKVFRN